MIIEFEKDIFLEKLTLASRFTSDRLTTASALQGVLFIGDSEKISLFATNLNTYYSTTIPVPVSEEFRLILEPRKIIEFLQFLPPGLIKLDIKDKQLTISQQKTKGNFPTLVSEDFPLPPDISQEEQKFDAQFFIKNIPRVLFSASSDDARPVLTGINFVASEEELLLVSTDGFRLSLMKEKRKGNISSMIIPADFLTEVLRNMKEVQEVFFAYSATEKIVYFKVAEDTFFSRLIEGEFPPFERVIPSEVKTTVKVEKAELLRNVKLIAVFARDFSNVIVCEFKQGEILIRPKKEGNEENNAVQEASVEGEDQKVAFNFKYLIDFLNNIDSKMITIEILRSDAPIAFKIEENPSFVHIIMPVRIQE